FRVLRFSPEDGTFQPQYRFSTREVEFADFAGMCQYHQTSPRSSFTRQKVCSLATGAGRITLTDDRLIVTDHGKRTESPIGSIEEFDRALERYFAIHR
ncbi:MAG TPA: arylamine N-acetyltransferase, partial [Bacteroidota bacterium]